MLAATSVDLRSEEPGESAPVRIRRLLEKPVDWEMVLRLADNHGTSSLLYQNLSPFGRHGSFFHAGIASPAL